MLITYDKFIEELNRKIKSGEDFYLELLETVIDNPSRYCGLFRLSNAKTKLIQNVTQSREIKFGDFMESIVTEYIDLIGYENKNKDIGCDENGDRLNVDQLFVKDNNVYLIEQKIRDDHDSTKKRGQFANFDKKVRLIHRQYPTYHLCGIMWFIDDSLTKNKNYYTAEMNSTIYDNCELKLFYGGELFEYLENGQEVWDEILDHLMHLRLESSNDILSIPDFSNSEEIYHALLKLPQKYWSKLNSNAPKYQQIRKELFSSGNNLEKAKKARF